jgi:hypothetical protein
MFSPEKFCFNKQKIMKYMNWRSHAPLNNCQCKSLLSTDRNLIVFVRASSLYVEKNNQLFVTQ